MNQLETGQTSPETIINENFETLSHVATYGENPATTSALIWGYYGGRWGGFSVADGTFTLTNNSANYIVAAVADGATTCSASTTNWNDSVNYKRAYKVTTVSGAVSSTEDHRGGPGGVHGSGGGTGGSLTADTDGTLAANSDSNVATQKATKTYVDAKVAGLSWKQAVRAASTANGTLASAFENGDTIDGVTLATGNRILLKNQSSASENGIYTVNASGAPTRATDADSGAELVNATVYVSEGTTLADTQWTCTTNATITVNSTSLAFAQLSTGGGDASTNTSSAVDSEIALFSSTTGKLLKRATGSGLANLTSGVLSAVGGSDDDFAQRKSGAFTNRTVAQVSADLQGTGLLTDAVGFRTIPQNSKSAAYTTVAADAGKHIYHPGADTTARTWTIDSNANVAYPIGTAITFINDASGGVITIAITSDTLLWAPTGGTGSRSLAANGIATAVKMTSTRWIISGVNLT